MPDRKRLERIKTALIALLTASALALLYLAFAQQGAALLRSGPSAEPETAAYADGPLPVAVVVTNENAERFSAAYDAAAVSAVRASVRHKWIVAERNCTVASLSGSDYNFSPINKH